MKRTAKIWLTALALLLAASLPAPGWGLAKEEAKTHPWGVEKERLAKELNLSPEKTKDFLAVNEKYEKSRKEIFEAIKKDEDQLAKLLAEPKPDEARVKGMVTAITQDFDKLTASFKAQRQEEMAVLTPLQQGKFILALKKWHEEMCARYEKTGEKQEEKK
jgi:Spy/CpxP family protein refolding chaperone